MPSQPATARFDTMQLYASFFDTLAVRSLVSSYNPCDPDWGETDCCCTYHKFYYIVEGEGALLVRGQSFVFQPETLYLIPAGTVHTFRHNPARPIVKYWCHFALASQGDLALTGHPDTLCCHLPFSQGIPLFRALIEADRQSEPVSSLHSKAAVLHLIGYFLSQVSLATALASPRHDPATDLRAYIRAHIRDKLTLTQLADRVHMHPNYFIKYFRSRFSESPIQYINHIRLELAGQLLSADPGKSIKEIAGDVGFDDYHYFVRLFKRHYGVVPSLYRATRHHDPDINGLV